MPGKRKKERKGPKNGKGSKNFGTPDRGNHNGPAAKAHPRGRELGIQSGTTLTL